MSLRGFTFTAAVILVPVQLIWAGTNCYTFKTLVADDVYIAAYNALSAKREGFGGWDITKRLDDERTFAFHSFHGGNSESWRGVSGSVSVKQTKGGAVLAITTRRNTPFQAIPQAKDNDACLIAVQIVRYLGFKNPIRCDQLCRQE